MEQWQDAASQQVKLITARLTELLTRGQLWLRTVLGVDLGLDPELIPPWVILLAACSGLLLMVALWASVCRAVFKKQPAIQAVNDSGVGAKRNEKPAKEEPKKKKKKSEKKSQPNGRAVLEPQEEEAVETEEIVPHHHRPPPAEVKTEKTVEVKKSKKKAKQAVKEPSKIVTAEPEEGTWETKVSNKEKREQRKKDKGSSDGSSSPGGANTPVTTTSEQPKGSPAAPPANQKKRDKVKPEKVEAVVPKVPVKADPAAVPVLMTEVTKVPPQTLAPKVVNWATNRDPASLWGSEIEGSWPVTDNSSLGTFTGLRVSAPEQKSVSELAWLSQPAVDDEWSGINGGPVDCNSDWDAPSEMWGNYEEPAPDAEPVDESSVPEPDKINLLIEAADDDNEKDKEDLSGDGTAKSKRKKKKKKKATEESATTGQGEEAEKEAPLSSVKKQSPAQENPASVQIVKQATSGGKGERTTKENAVQKQPVTQVPLKPADGDPTANSNPPAPTQQKKPEEIQAPKPAKKKKARRET